MIKRILFYCYFYTPFGNANLNVMMPFIDELKRHYTIDVLAKNNTNFAPRKEIIDEITVYRFKNEKRILNFLLSLSLTQGKKRPLWKQMIVCPAAATGKLIKRFYAPEEPRLLEQLIRDNRYDLVISLSEPIATHLNMLYYKQRHHDSPKWIAYYQDPYAYNVARKNDVEFNVKIETDIYKACDLAAVTSEMYEDNKTNAFRPYLDKTVAVGYPNMSFSGQDKNNRSESSGPINCLYSGSLYALYIRSPEYLYRVFNLLDDSINLTMICYQVNGENQKLIEKYCRGKKNIRFYYNMPLQESLEMIRKADVLINLGNKVTQHTPSKVFDYIGTGKPIVNFHSLEDDTSRRYLSKYPLCLNVYEQEEKLEENAEKFETFCKENKGKFIAQNEILRRYSNFTKENIAKKMLDIVGGVLGNKEYEI